MTEFVAAPWPRVLKITTTIGSLLLIGLTVILGAYPVARWVAGAPFVIWGLCLLYMVRGYRIEDKTLYIKRLFQETKIPLDGLKKVEHRPKALINAQRLLGNGGLFAFTGLFRNQDLGNFRLYATSPKDAVILYLPTQTIVITPANTQGLITKLQFLLTPDQ